MHDSVHFEKGTATDVAFVFSCPGQAEESARPPRPASGGTGDNLRDLLCITKKKYGRAVARISGPSVFRRGCVRIACAWDKVEYELKTGRSEATDGEILDRGNLDRLQSELSGIQHAIICCGDKASLAVDRLRDGNELEPTVGVFRLPHLGNKALNNRWRNKTLPDGCSPAARRRLRIGRVAECLSAQIDLWFASKARRQSAIVANSPWESEDQAFVDAISVWNEE